jgi:hypothetical protein
MGQTKTEPGERVKAYGHFGIYSPYESHDGDVGWTVQKFSEGDDVGDMGDCIAEFVTRDDAELFALTKYSNGH